jgi:hypothetical protein
MRGAKKERISYPLRLPKSLRDRARLLAAQEGISLNHFISLAVAEKASRLEAATPPEAPPSIEQSTSALPQHDD